MKTMFRFRRYLYRNERLRPILSMLLPCFGVFAALFFLFKIGDFVQIKLLLAPFAASCTMLFGFPESPFSKNRNVIGSYFLCSLVGVGVFHLWGNDSYELVVAVSLAVLLMLSAKVVHPPASAITILAVDSGAQWWFILVPVLLGAIIIVVCAHLYHRLRYIE